MKKINLYELFERDYKTGRFRKIREKLGNKDFGVKLNRKIKIGILKGKKVYKIKRTIKYLK